MAAMNPSPSVHSAPFTESAFLRQKSIRLAGVILVLLLLIALALQIFLHLGQISGESVSVGPCNAGYCSYTFNVESAPLGQN
jgi:hypothetical protein